MAQDPILTIAIPIYNMERWLDKNLATYQVPELEGRLEVLCLNNASEDKSKEIIGKYIENCPKIFTLVDRLSRGYGGSINEAMTRTRGRYFRIIDADDWADTGELIKLVHKLEQCEADVVLTDYEIVNMKTGGMTPVRAGVKGVEYEVKYSGFGGPIKTLPSIHATTYRTDLLRKSGFQMQDNIFFVDEEYVILPYLWAKSVIYYPFDVYRYQVSNPEQSTSPKNRAKYQEHREKVLKRLILEYQKAEKENPNNPALPYCFERIRRGVGDQFTTLYMYIEDRKEGRRLAAIWRDFIQRFAPAFWLGVEGKAKMLWLCNLACLRLEFYDQLKKFLGVSK